MDVNTIRANNEGLGRSLQATKELLIRNGVIIKENQEDMLEYLLNNY